MPFTLQLAGSSAEQLSGGSIARQDAFYDCIYPPGFSTAMKQRIECGAEIINQSKYFPEQTGNVEIISPLIRQ